MSIKRNKDDDVEFGSEVARGIAIGMNTVNNAHTHKHTHALANDDDDHELTPIDGARRDTSECQSTYSHVQDPTQIITHTTQVNLLHIHHPSNREHNNFGHSPQMLRTNHPCRDNVLLALGCSSVWCAHAIMNI